VSTRRKPSSWKRFRYRLEGLLLELLAALVPRLPRKTLVGLANAAGGFAFHLVARERRIALTNLDIAFGSTKSAEEKRRIACSAFQTFARSFLGLFWSRRLTEATLEQLVEVDTESLRLVEKARARGKGIIFITLHYGEWELLGLATALRNFPMTIVTEQLRNPHVTRIFERLRGRAGSRIILQRLAVTKLFKALKRGECIALLIDLNALPSRGGIWLDFFGKPVFSYSAAAALALHTGAAIIAAVAHPLPDGRMRIVYGPEIPHAATGNDEADLRVVSQDCLRFCEEMIRQRPEHWLWFYRRWKFRPTAEVGGFPYYSRYIEEVRPRRNQTIQVNQSPAAPQERMPNL
jgi:lauroyl/myristoyl acyltransferase